MASPIKQEARMITVFPSTSITSAASAYGTVIDLTQSSGIGVWYRALPTTAASGIRVWYESSYINTSTLYCIPDGGTDIITALNDSLPHITSVLIPPMRYVRICATCDSTAASDLVLTVVAFVQ